MTMSRLLRSLIAAALGIGLIIALFHITGTSFEKLRDLISRLNWTAFFGIVVCTLLYIWLGGIKWHLISGGREPRRFFYLHYTAQAMLIGQFLPMPVAVAVNRAAVMKFKQNAPVKKGLLNAVYDMGFDFFIAAAFVPASLLQLVYGFKLQIWIALGVLCIGVGVPAILITLRFLPRSWQHKLDTERKQGLLAPKLIALMIALSLIRFAITIVRLALGAKAIVIFVPVSTVAYATAPSTLSALLAITPGNLGIAEWSWAYLLTLWGVAATTGTLYGVGFRILVCLAQLFASALCWGAYIWTEKEKIDISMR